MSMKKVMNNNAGCIIVSLLLGLGLATMFHKVCAGRDCVVVKGPNVDYVTSHTWRHDEGCFKYHVDGVDCPGEGSGTGAEENATDDVI